MPATEAILQRMRHSAEARFGDAEALVGTGRNARAVGATSMPGLVVDTLLKSLLLERHPHLRPGHDARALSRRERRIRTLIYHVHDIADALDHLPELHQTLAARGRRIGIDLLRQLGDVASIWTIPSRYSTQPFTIAESRRLVNQFARSRRN